jgi:hypothetical protein
MNLSLLDRLRSGDAGWMHPLEKPANRVWLANPIPHFQRFTKILKKTNGHDPPRPTRIAVGSFD